MKHRLALFAIPVLIMILFTLWHSRAYTDSIGIEDGDVAGLQYKLTNKDTGAVLDEQNNTVLFAIKENSLIQGFYEGVLGMKIGERKVFEIPPSKGYTDPATAPPGFYGITIIADVYVVSISSGMHDDNTTIVGDVVQNNNGSQDPLYSLLPFQPLAALFAIAAISYVTRRNRT